MGKLISLLWVTVLSSMLIACNQSNEVVVDGEVIAAFKPGAPVGGPFELVMAEQTVTLDQFTGKPLVIYFGFTHCPDICPASMGWIKQGLALVPDIETQVLFVSVDFVNDDEQTVKQYARSFGEQFTGAIGTPDQVFNMAQAYKMHYSFAQQDDGSMAVSHASRVFVVDTKGDLVFLLPHGTPPQQIANAIRFAVKR